MPKNHFLNGCIADEILSGNCDDLIYYKKQIEIGPGLANLLSATHDLQNVLDGIKGKSPLNLREADLGTETYCLNAKPVIPGLRNDRIDLNTNPKLDYRKASDSAVLGDLLNELDHEANPNSNDDGMTHKNAHMIEMFSDGDICKSAAFETWIHRTPGDACCKKLKEAKAKK